MAQQHGLNTVDLLPVERQNAGAIMEQVIVKGDLAQLRPEDRARYYVEVCRSLGINELTQPFQYIELNKKLTLYATRTATDQLRKVHGVTITELSERTQGDIFIVTAKAVDRDGRQDISTGAVNIKGMFGENLANAFMKCETKAKRRVTLSIVGLGWLDESEVASVTGARIVRVDTETGEILDEDAAAAARPNEQPPQRAPSLYPTRESKVEEHRKTEMKRYHAVTADLGLTEAAQALFAHALGKTDSRADLSGGELADLTDFAEQELRRIGEDGQTNPQTDCANKIAAAADEDAINGLVREMVNAGLVAEFLVAMTKRRRAEVQQGESERA